MSALFTSGLAFYVVYGPGHENRTAGSIGFILAMAVRRFHPAASELDLTFGVGRLQ
jgi:hypothetical protein